MFTACSVLLNADILWWFLMLPQKLKVVIGELESLKPEFHRQLDELSKVNDSSQQYQIEGTDITPYVSKSPSSEWPLVNSRSSLGFENKLVRRQSSISITHYFWVLEIFQPYFCAMWCICSQAVQHMCLLGSRTILAVKFGHQTQLTCNSRTCEWVL